MPAQGTDDRLVDGRYERRQPLGRGGFGVVWRAHDRLLQRDVAIKEIEFPSILDAAEMAVMRDKVLREARAAARLSHPGAVTVFDVVEENGRPLIVMELVESPTLADRVARDGPFDDQKAAALGIAMLDALEAAHTQGIIHRDVKPANVMVSESGRVQLADFGVASIIDDPKVTSSGIVAGSPSYMAPEQAQSLPTDPATDFWGFGATLYFAVEGAPPYEKPGAIPTLTSVVNDPPRPFARATTLAPVIAALLTKNPATRPGAEELRRRLADVLGGDGARNEANTTAELEAVALTPPPPPPSPPRPPSPPTPPATAARPEPTPPVQPAPARPTPGPSPAERRDRPSPRPLAWILGAAVALVAAVMVAVVAGRDEEKPSSTAAPPAEQEAPAASAVPGDWVPYTDPETGFTIAHPRGWSVRRNGTLTDFVDPSTGAYLRVDYTRSPGPSPEADWYEFEPRFAAENPNYRRIQITPTTYQGYPAAIWEFAYGSGGREHRSVDLGFVAGRYGFALNFQTPAAEWDRLQPIFDSFKAAFRAPA